MKKLLFILLLLVFINPALSQDNIILNPDITLTVHPGFEDYYKTNKWFPVTVIVENRGTSVKGELVIKVNSSYGVKPDDVHKYVEIPSNTSKRFEFYLSPDYAYYWGEIIIELINSSGKKIVSIKEKIQQLDVYQTLVLVLSTEKAGLNYLNGPQTGLWANSNLMILYPQKEYLPRSWIGYQGVEIIIINNFSILDSMDELQRKALENWLISGGKLVVSSNGSPMEFSNTFLEEFLPLKLEENILVKEMNSLGEFTKSPVKISSPGMSIIKGSLKEKFDSKIVLIEGNIPIIATSCVGNGKITFISFDISREPFKDWDGKMPFWSKILSDLYKYQSLPGELPDDKVRNILYDIPSLQPPSFKFIGIFLFIYILLVGPLNYYFLKKWDKREFAVITIPVLVILFSIGTYVIGYSSKGGSVILNQVSIINLNDSFNKTIINNFISLFSPNKTNYKLEFPGEYAYASDISKDYQNNTDLIIREDQNFILDDIYLNMWSMVIFRNYVLKEFPGGISLKELKFTNDKNKTKVELSGKIINNTDRILSDCCLIYNSEEIAYIGELNKGEKDLQVGFYSRAPSGADMSKDWIDKCNINLNETEGKIMENLSDNIMEQLFLKQPESLILCGWNKEEINKIILNKTSKKININLFICKLNTGKVK